MGMNARTLATLGQLRAASWFSAVGVRDTKNARVLSSWQEAIDSCSSPSWEELCLEAANQYSLRVRERAPTRFGSWNELVVEIKPVTLALVREKSSEVVEKYGLPKVFVDSVDWDILHVCLEAEFADVYPPGFFASQAYWYVAGHFPCGWEGSFPAGRLVIF